jgi:hypothetical protein
MACCSLLRELIGAVVPMHYAITLLRDAPRCEIAMVACCVLYIAPAASADSRASYAARVRARRTCARTAATKPPAAAVERAEAKHKQTNSASGIIIGAGLPPVRSLRGVSGRPQRSDSSVRARGSGGCGACDVCSPCVRFGADRIGSTLCASYVPNTSVSFCIRVRGPVATHTNTTKQAHTHARARTHARTHTRARARTHTHTRARTRARMHAHARTHTNAGGKTSSAARRGRPVGGATASAPATRPGLLCLYIRSRLLYIRSLLTVPRTSLGRLAPRNAAARSSRP